MNKLFTLVAAAMLTAGVANAQKASDSYLDLSNYTSIDEALDGGKLQDVTTFYSYTDGVLTLPIVACIENSKQQKDGSQAWITYNQSSGANATWDATGVFKGSAFYYGETVSQYATLRASRSVTFRVTGTSGASALVVGSDKSSAVISAYEVTDGTAATTATATATSTTQANEVISISGLEASKIYDIVLNGTSSNNNGAYAYEIAFTAASGSPTGINAIEKVAESSAIYNLAGQKVSADYKGVVIKNGKKYLNK